MSLSKDDCNAVFRAVHRGRRGKVTPEQLREAMAFFEDVEYQIEYYTALLESVRQDLLDVVFDRNGEMCLGPSERAVETSQSAKLERLGV